MAQVLEHRDDFMDLTEAHWTMLHELRLRGLMLVESCAFVDDVVALGAVRVRGKYLALTDDGRAMHAVWARVADDSAGYLAAARLHEGFHELNVELLTICTAWQVRPTGAANDHSDAKYDWDVIDKLERLHERSAPRMRRVARDISRFDGYDRRLRSALKRVIEDGDREWFASPRVDSYHTVWNHFHEDLLLALGRDRADEPQP